MIILNKELFLDMLYIAIISSFIASQTIQKIKDIFNFSKIINKIIAIIISLLTGFLYSLSFYTSNLLYASWISLFTLIGADSIYNTFKGYFGLKSKSGIDGNNEK